MKYISSDHSKVDEYQCWQVQLAHSTTAVKLWLAEASHAWTRGIPQPRTRRHPENQFLYNLRQWLLFCVVGTMERRKLLRGFLRFGAKDLTQLSEWLHMSSQRELAIVYKVLSDLYDKKLILGQKFTEIGGSVANWAVSPVTGAPYRKLASDTPAHIVSNYELVKAGRREFLVVGGVVMAAVVGATLYYVNPSFRSLVREPPHEDETTKTSVTAHRTAEIEETTATRTYRMTTSTVGYYQAAQMGEGYDMHFKIVRRGKVSEVRKTLASIGVAYFQDTIQKKFGQQIPKSKIRVGFEREEPAARVRKSIEVQARRLEYKRGHWTCTHIPLEVLDYDKWN